MAVSAVRFILMLKAKLKSPFTYVWMAMIASFLLLIKGTMIPSEKPSEVLLLNLSGGYGERVVESLTGPGSEMRAYVYREVSDEESMRSAVVSGKAMCGFIFPEDMEAKIADGDTKHMITMVTSSFSVKAPAVRESVFAALFRYMYFDMAESSEEILFEDPLAVKEFIRERYEYYSAGNDVFGVEYETVPGGNNDEGILKDSSDPIRGSAAVLIFILSLFSGGALLGKGGNFFRALKKGEKAVSIFLYELACIFLPSCAAFAVIRILDPGRVSFAKDLILFVIFMILSGIWSGLFVSAFRKSEIYFPAVSVLLFVCFVLSPVYFDPAKYIPVLGMVTRILPTSFYLYLL